MHEQPATGLERQVEAGAGGGQLVRARLEPQPGAAHAVVETGVGQQHAVLVDLRRSERAVLRTWCAPRLEQVGEVGEELDLDIGVPRLHIEIAQQQPLVAGAIPQEPGAAQVDEVVRQRLALPLRILRRDLQFRVGQVARQRRVVFAQRGRQQDRAHAAQAERQRRQVPGVQVVEAVGDARAEQDVAAMVEHPEQVAMLERMLAAFGDLRGSAHDIGVRHRLDRRGGWRCRCGGWGRAGVRMIQKAAPVFTLLPGLQRGNRDDDRRRVNRTGGNRPAWRTLLCRYGPKQRDIRGQGGPVLRRQAGLLPHTRAARFGQPGWRLDG